MDQKKLMQQMLDYNQSSFNTTYEALSILQDQAEKMASTLIDHPNLLPEEGKNIIREWVKTVKLKRDEYKEQVNNNFEKLKIYFD